MTQHKHFAAERRSLQIAVLVASLVPIAAGAVGVIDGPRMIAGAASHNIDLASHFRYLSGILLGLGLGFLAMVPAIERWQTIFGTLGAVVILGGIARAFSALVDGSPNSSHMFALAMELGVTPILLIWQRRIARLARPNPSTISSPGLAPLSARCGLAEPDLG